MSTYEVFGNRTPEELDRDSQANIKRALNDAAERGSRLFIWQDEKVIELSPEEYLQSQLEETSTDASPADTSSPTE